MALVDYRVENGIAELTLNDPPVNAYTHEMMRELDEAVLKARFDTSVNVIVLTGHGDRFFCAGANIQMLARSDPTWKYYFCLHANETLLRLEHTPKLVIGALNGTCVGGGLEIALATDIRLARKGAGKLGMPEVNLGVLPGTGGTQRLGRLIGRPRAIELMATGELFEFERGLELGIVNHVVESKDVEDFRAKVRQYAAQFTTPKKAAMAVGHIKRAVCTGIDLPLEQGLAVERELQAKLFSSADAKEGLTAFVEKRKAAFSAK